MFTCLSTFRGVEDVAPYGSGRGCGAFLSEIICQPDCRGMNFSSLLSEPEIGCRHRLPGNARREDGIIPYGEKVRCSMVGV